MTTLPVAYDRRLLNWQLGKGHPTNPMRAKLAVTHLRRMGVPMTLHPLRDGTMDELLSVHSPEYLRSLLKGGKSTEWVGRRPDLAATARLMFGGTMAMVDLMLADEGVQVAFTPMGSKHHAHRDHGSGFCVLADFPAAAIRFKNAGRRVAVLDTDAHAGDGTEAILRLENDIMTCSIHDRTAFPGTGHYSEPENGVFNWPLAARSGDTSLLAAVSGACDLIRAFKPDVLLLAHGADGHREDPLTSLTYSTAGMVAAASLAADMGVPQVLCGGAGGYTPYTHTPEVWAKTVGVFYRAVQARDGLLSA